MTESTEQTTPTNGGGLASLKLAQLQALASQLGIAGGSRMRKADLVTAISDHQRGGSVADRDAAERAARELRPLLRVSAVAFHDGGGPLAHRVPGEPPVGAQGGHLGMVAKLGAGLRHGAVTHSPVSESRTDRLVSPASIASRTVAANALVEPASSRITLFCDILVSRSRQHLASVV